MTVARTTRRAVLALGLAALPVAALATPVDPDARFLEWEREATTCNAAIAEARGLSDQDLDTLMDRAGHFEELIATTPAAGLTGARVKVAYLLGSRADRADEANVWQDRVDMSALRTLLEAVTRAAG